MLRQQLYDFRHTVLLRNLEGGPTIAARSRHAPIIAVHLRRGQGSTPGAAESHGHYPVHQRP